MSLGKTNLRPFERRLIVAVGVVLFIVVNLVFVRPYFFKWGQTRQRLLAAHETLDRQSREIAQQADYENKIKALQEEGAEVEAEDQANLFFRAVQNQASLSGVSLPSISRQAVSTNEFFMEQLQTYRLQATEEQLVDFLYNLGEGESVIRARGLSVRAAAGRQQLEGTIDLVASYQKNPKKPAAKPAAASPQTKNVKKL